MVVKTTLNNKDTVQASTLAKGRAASEIPDDTAEHADYSDQKDFFPIFSIFLVFIEIVANFILRIDRPLLNQLRLLFDQEALVRIRVFAPKLTFYMRFNRKGILLDAACPVAPDKTEVDATIYVSFLRLIQHVLVRSKQAKKHVRIVGDDASIVAALYNMMSHFSVFLIAKRWAALSVQYPLREMMDAVNAARTPKNTVSKSVLLKELQEYKQRVDQLVLEGKQKDYQLQLLRRRLRTRSILVAVLIVVYVVSIVGIALFFWLH